MREINYIQLAAAGTKVKNLIQAVQVYIALQTKLKSKYELAQIYLRWMGLQQTNITAWRNRLKPVVHGGKVFIAPNCKNIAFKHISDIKKSFENASRKF